MRAGVLSAGRASCCLAVGLIAGVTAGVVLGWVAGPAAGTLAGLAVTGVVTAALLARGVVLLSPADITLRTLFGQRTISWDAVTSADFAVAGDRWTLILNTAGEHLILLSLVPVTGPVTNPAALDARTRTVALRELLRERRIPVTLDGSIASALHTHWGIAPPAG